VTLDELLDRAELGTVTADDLAALDADDPDLRDALDELEHRHRDGYGRWSSTTLLDAERCEVAVFAVAAGEEIPLHDHPGMTVHQRVLRGAVAVDAWDLLDAVGTSRAARHVGEALVREGDAAVALLPDRANIHRLRAVVDAVFIDVLTPPYGDGRRCSEWRVEVAPDAAGSGRLTWVRWM
jgi:hypothetical protein